jgi:hypothetical protein
MELSSGEDAETRRAQMNANSNPAALLTALRRELYRLADAEDDAAATEAATVPYWAPYPPTVQGRRIAAAVLRADADRLLEAS